MSIALLKNHITSITKYLSPLLPLANCHMVEFITQDHWKLLPDTLKCYLEETELNDAVEEFWECHLNQHTVSDKSELSRWVAAARSHYVAINDLYCLSAEQLAHRIQSWGGDIKHEIMVTEFMTNKKSYEVQTMSRLVASLFSATGATCSVEAGGGRGHLQVALCLGYRVPSLTVDCNEQAVRAAERRVNIIKKQWHVIAKRTDGSTEPKIAQDEDTDLHRFATAFITRESDLAATVRTQFPDHADTRLLLTGLHTCGDLGPECVRMFARRATTAGVFTVPCCYHLLDEHPGGGAGFPMSTHLAGYSLGRNARMLANHSIDRVVSQRETPPNSLVYRAMLEVIIKTHAQSRNISTGKLKRISSKATTFQQYFQMADEVLKLGIYQTFPENVLSDLIKNEPYYRRQLFMFYLVKLTLAQVVESLILLDRVLYLCERGFDKVYLVKLFNPVLSPRCHSIVAVRNE